MSTLSAISWSSGGVEHTEVFGIGVQQHRLHEQGRRRLRLGGRLRHGDRAGLDAAGNPEVYGIGGDNAVWVNDNGSGWVSRGGYVTAISATVDNTVFAIGSDNAVCVNRGGTGWTDLGGDVKAISAGLDAAGNPEVYGIGGNNAVWVNDNGTGGSTWAATSRRSARR